MFCSVLLLAALALSVRAHSDANHSHDAHAHEEVGCINHIVQKQVNVSVDPQQYSYLNADGSYKKRNVKDTLETAPLRVHFDTFYLGGESKARGCRKKKKEKKKKKKISLVDDFFFFFFFFFHHLIHFSGGTSRFDCLSVGQTVTVMETTHTCTANMILSQETRNKVVRVLDRLKREVGNQLSIVRADRLALRDSYPWCWDESIDMRSRYGTSANNPIQSQIDVVFFVTAWPAKGAAAWCGYCRTDQYGRPIGGHMNFSPSHVATASELELYATAMHELFHGLGFEEGRVQKQIRNNRIVSGVETITIGSASEGTKQVDIVTSPRVVAEARKHFNCPTLRGVELEDNAKQGRYGSHWEKRVMGTDVITPTLHQDDKFYGPRVSRITLAYFEDLGYYYPNYTTATHFGYGLGAGCDFVERPARLRPNYACPSGSGYGNVCSPEGDGVGWCSGFTAATCPPLFQQPDTANCNRVGDTYADFALEPSVSTSCTDPGTPTVMWNGQVGGPSSQCFMSMMVPRQYAPTTFGATCLPMQCPGDPNGEAAPVPPPPPPSGGGSSSGGSSTQYANYLNCESCTDNGGEWCDSGWNQRTWTRAGTCVDARTGCSQWLTTVTNSAQCYPECEYRGDSGQCRGAQNCQVGGGSTYSSRAGATGCSKEPGSVMCCIGAEFKRKRTTDEVAEAAVVVEEEAPKNEKRANDGVKVKVGQAWYQCPAEGGEVQFGQRGRSDYFGSFRCPPLSSICCSERNFCNWRGKCVRGFCNCNAGFHGDECELTAELPVATAPSRSSWSFQPQFVMDLPNIDLPQPSDDELGLVPEEVPDGAGKVQRVSESSSDADNDAGIDQTTLIVIVAVVVVVVLVAVGVGAALFFVYKRKNKSTVAHH
jgi:hypothetical protein